MLEENYYTLFACIKLQYPVNVVHWV